MALQFTSCTLSNSPSLLLNKGAEYFRRHSTHEDIFAKSINSKSAVELLAASKGDYVKSTHVLDSKQTAVTNNFASDTRFPQPISGQHPNTHTKSDYDLSQRQTADRTSDGTFKTSAYPSCIYSNKNSSNTKNVDPMMDVDRSMASSDVEGCCPSLDTRHFSASTCSREVTKMDTSQSGGGAVVTTLTADAPNAMTADGENDVEILLSSSQPTTAGMLAAKAAASQSSSSSPPLPPSIHMTEAHAGDPLTPPSLLPPLPPPPPPLPVPSSSAPTPASLMMTDDDFVELLPESLAQHLPSRNSEVVVMRRQQQQQQQQQKRPMHRSQSDVTYLRTRSRTNSSELFGLGLGLGIGVAGSGGGVGNTLSMSSTTSSPRSSTSRLSHASAELERFFNEMGIDRTILEPMLREHEDSVKKEKQGEKMRERERERERESDFLETLSSLDSPDTRSICSGGLSYSEKGQTESGVDRPDGQISNSNSASASAATPSSAQTSNTSIVERNARIIRWLCNVKKARSPSTN